MFVTRTSFSGSACALRRKPSDPSYILGKYLSGAGRLTRDEGKKVLSKEEDRMKKFLRRFIAIIGLLVIGVVSSLVALFLVTAVWQAVLLVIFWAIFFTFWVLLMDAKSWLK